MERLLELFTGSDTVLLKISLGRGFELDLLLVEKVLSNPLSHLCLIDLRLVCVLAILVEPDLGAPLGMGAVAFDLGLAGGERFGGRIERFLVAVDPGLLTIGDPLIEIDDGLFLVEVALEASLLIRGGLDHRGASAAGSPSASVAGRPMW